jgi:hypothetical protein
MLPAPLVSFEPGADSEVNPTHPVYRNEGAVFSRDGDVSKIRLFRLLGLLQFSPASPSGPLPELVEFSDYRGYQS